MRRGVSIGILVILWALWLWGVTAWFWLGPKIDYAAYYDASVRWLNGEGLYNGLTGVVYLYPPLTAQAVSLSSSVVDRTASELVWHIASIVMMFAALIALSWRFRQEGFALVVWALPLLFTPFLQSYWVGQVSMILLLCFALAWLWMKQDRREWAGAILALAAWVKVYPGLVLLYFVLRRDWRVVKGGAIGGVVLALVQFVLAPREFIAYFTTWLPQLLLNGQGTEGVFKNNSLLGFSQRLLIDTRQSEPLLIAPEWVSPLRWLLAVLMIAMTAWVISRRKYNPRGTSFDVDYALLIVVALLFGSTLWTSGMPPLIIAYVLAFANTRNRLIQGMLAVSFALVTWMLPQILAIPAGADMQWYTMSVGFFGTVLLWFSLIVMGWRDESFVTLS